MDTTAGRGAAVIVSGGVAHDFPGTSAELARVLGEAGFTATVTEDVEAALTGLGGPGDGGAGARRPLLVLNLLRWTMHVERYLHLREQWAISLSAAARAALADHVRSGGGLLALHGASICFDDWPGWKDILGGVWDWETSTHPLLDGPVAVRVARDAHPVVAGVEDFRIVDEVYGFLDRADDVTGLLFAPHGGADHPLLWARTVGRGRVVYDALGHHVPSYEVPGHRLVVRRSAVWAAGGTPAQVAAGSLG